MKIIACSNSQVTKKRPAVLERALPVMNRVLGQRGPSGDEAVIAALQRVLDNRYTLLRNITLPGLEVPIPLVLVGPSGVRVIYPSTAQGVFRADAELWEQLDERSKRYRPVSPSLTNRTHLMGKVVQAYLDHRSIAATVEPVLFFIHPGVHVDSARPLVRIVLMDALERFASGLLSSPAVLEPEAAQALVAALAPESVQPDAAAPDAASDAFSFQDLPAPRPSLPAAQVVIEHSEPAILKKVPFSRRQWVVLGALLMTNIVILTTLIVVVLATS